MGLVTNSTTLFAQTYLKIDAIEYGLKGDGKTDNTAAFRKLSQFINQQGGNVVVTFSKGTYLAGIQRTDLKREGFFLSAEDVFELSMVKNVTINGEEGTIFKYNMGLFFGSFSVPEMKPLVVTRDFYTPGSAAYVGNFIKLKQCQNVAIQQIILDGNADASIAGGVYGDVGIQIPYTGIYIENCLNISMIDLKSINFGLDGCQIANAPRTDGKSDDVLMANCEFSLNGRQGLSWVRGNQFLAKNCRFNLTGKGKYSSNPGAGVDLEAEDGFVRNGHFINCVFENNSGCGLVSETGNVSDCRFDSCTFIGVTNWSVWVRKPAFTFFDCKIYGSGVHGYDAADDYNATKFIRCLFSDELYQKKTATYGTFLFESNGVKKLTFDSCIFEAKYKKLIWLEGNPAWPSNDYYKVTNSILCIESALPNSEYYAVLRKVQILNNNWQIGASIQKNKNYAAGFDSEHSINILRQNKIDRKSP